MPNRSGAGANLVSEDTISFDVPGLPAPWGVFPPGDSCKRCDPYRQCARCARKQRLKNYQAEVQTRAKKAMQGQEPTKNIVGLELSFGCPRDGWLKWDTTNLQKACEDALKQIVFEDDKQVWWVTSDKYPASDPITRVVVDCYNATLRDALGPLAGER